MKNTLLVLLLSLSLFAGFAFGYGEYGLHPHYSYTASGSGMGNAVVSLPAHPSNIWINPGGLAFQNGALFYVAPHDEVSGVSDDIRDRVFMGSMSGIAGGTVGGAFLLRQYDNQHFTSDERIFPFDLNETAFLFSYGRIVGEKYGFGASVLGYKHCASVDELQGDMTIGLTVGTLRKWNHTVRETLPLELRCALAVDNMGPRFNMGTGDDEGDLPLNVRTGFSAKWEKERGTHIVGSADFYTLYRDIGNGSDWDRFGGGIGFEGKMNNVMAVRLGYLWEDWDDSYEQSGFTYGFGVGNEVYEHIGGMLEYGHAPGENDFADHIGVSLYWIQ